MDIKMLKIGDYVKIRFYRPLFGKIVDVTKEFDQYGILYYKYKVITIDIYHKVLDDYTSYELEDDLTYIAKEELIMELL